jgi:hypothetical protein
MTDTRAARLAEVERLSRKPHADLHAKLIDSVLGAMDQLTADEWLILARKGPDRLLQALAMSGRLAGYSDKQEVELSGSIAAIQAMSDSEKESLMLSEAEKELSRLGTAVPAIGAVIADFTEEERRGALVALMGYTPLIWWPI